MTPVTTSARRRWPRAGLADRGPTAGAGVGHPTRRATVVALVGLAALPLLTACGRKTEPKPPQLVAPRAVAELSLTTLPDGVALRWSRPTHYVDGTPMEDLAGFVVERSRYNSSFTEVTRVAVTDRGRFQKARRFDWIDRQVLPDATYHYRIVAFTTDGYYSAPSGVATIVWSPAAPSPSPAASPGREERGRRSPTAPAEP